MKRESGGRIETDYKCKVNKELKMSMHKPAIAKTKGLFSMLLYCDSLFMSYHMLTYCPWLVYADTIVDIFDPQPLLDEAKITFLTLPQRKRGIRDQGSIKHSCTDPRRTAYICEANFKIKRIDKGSLSQDNGGGRSYC